MAGVALKHAENWVAAQVALVAELRWRLFRNSLRTWKGRTELAALVVLVVLGGLGAAGIGAGLGSAAYVFFARGKPDSIVWPLWAVFACWQLAPAVLAGFSVEFDFRLLLRFPLRFPAFVLLSLTYGLLDPPSVVAIFWTVSVGAGIFLARPELLPATLVILALFSAVNLLLNRLFLSWLERILARRRTREAFLVLVLLGLTSLQLIGALAERWSHGTEPVVQKLAVVARVLPPGLAGRAVAGAAQGDTRGLAGATALLVAYGLGFGLLLHRRLRAQYRGEDLGEGVARPTLSAETVESPAVAGWQVPGLSGPVAAMCEKELRYAVRNGQTILSLALPLVLVLFFAIAWHNPKVSPGFLARAPELFFPSAVAYSFLVLAPLMHNTFAFEGKGIQLLLVAPVGFQQVLLAKNLVHGLLVFTEAAVLWVIVSLLPLPVGAQVVAMTFSALLFLVLVHFVVGNWLSLYFPRQLEFGRFRKGASEISILVGLVSQLAGMGVVVAIALEARAAGSRWEGWVASAFYLVLSAVAMRGYIAALHWGARVAAKRQEMLTAELCR